MSKFFALKKPDGSDANVIINLEQIVSISKEEDTLGEYSYVTLSNDNAYEVRMKFDQFKAMLSDSLDPGGKL